MIELAAIIVIVFFGFQLAVYAMMFGAWVVGLLICFFGARKEISNDQ